MPSYWRVKAIIEFPGRLFRRAKTIAPAPERFVTPPLGKRLRRAAITDATGIAEPPWMAGFGGLSDLGDDHRCVREAIEDDFGGIPPESHARPATHEH